MNDMKIMDLSKGNCIYREGVIICVNKQEINDKCIYLINEGEIDVLKNFDLTLGKQDDLFDENFKFMKRHTGDSKRNFSIFTVQRIT